MAVDKLVDSTQLDADLTSVANAIRTKGGTSSDLAFPAGFVSAVDAIPTGGGGVDTLGALLDNTLTTFSHAGNVTLSKDLFKNKTSLTNISLPDVTDIPEKCFSGCTGISSYDFSSATTMAMESFYAFGKGVLSVIHLPNITTASAANSLSGCGNSSVPVTIVLPKLQTVQSDLFRGSITAAIDLGPNFTVLGNRTFYNATYPIIILRHTGGVVTMGNVNAIAGLNSSTKVYVPQALISSYETGTNWSTKSLTFYAIEGSIYENAYADGTPIPTT